MENAESTSRRGWIQLRRPLVEKLGGKYKVSIIEKLLKSAIRILHARAAPIPHAHADIQLLERSPIHVQRNIELEIRFRPSLVHFISGKELEIGIHCQRLIYRHIRLGLGQVVSPDLPAMLGPETTLHVLDDPIPFEIRSAGHGFHRREQERYRAPRPLLELLTIELEHPVAIFIPGCG